MVGVSYCGWHRVPNTALRVEVWPSDVVVFTCVRLSLYDGYGLLWLSAGTKWICLPVYYFAENIVF